MKDIEKLEKILKNIFLVLGMFLIILILYVTHLMSSFLVPIFIAFFTAFLLQPFIKKLEKMKVPDWLATIIVIVIAILVISLLLFLLMLYLRKFSNDIPKLSKQLTNISSKLINSFSESEFIKSFFDPIKIKSLISDFIKDIDLSNYMITTMKKTFQIFKDFIFFVIALIFILPGMNKISYRISRAFPDKSEKINSIINNIIEKIQKYIFVKSIISFCIAIIVIILCLIFKIKYAFLWGGITFIFHYVPYLGAFSSVFLTVAFSYVQYQSSFISLLLLIILSVCYAVFSEILEPKFQSEKVNLSPIVIFTSLLVWGYIWGIAGVFLAVPMMSSFNLICENIDVLKPYGLLISSRRKKVIP